MSMCTRREFLALVALGGATAARAAGPAGRRLDFTIGPGFGSASPADIEAVVRSAAESIWRHCPHTRWEVAGFHVFHRTDVPITLDDHTADGRVSIGLATGDTYWAQYAYQFAHEFTHALARHSNDWRALHRDHGRPNDWLEESLCEAASLFALRAMGREWATAAPYPNWRSFAPALTRYAAQRMEETQRSRSPAGDFAGWFRAQEAALRADCCQRALNNVVAGELLPLFEAEPAGWETLTCLNRTASREGQSLAERWRDWRRDTPEAGRAFVDRIGAVFGVRNPATASLTANGRE